MACEYYYEEAIDIYFELLLFCVPERGWLIAEVVPVGGTASIACHGHIGLVTELMMIGSYQFQNTVGGFNNGDSHSLVHMVLQVTMEKPHPWVIQFEPQYHRSVGVYQHGIPLRWV